MKNEISGIMGIGDWANPQSPIPNPQSPIITYYQYLKFLIICNKN